LAALYFSVSLQDLVGPFNPIGQPYAGCPIGTLVVNNLSGDLPETAFYVPVTSGTATLPLPREKGATVCGPEVYGESWPWLIHMADRCGGWATKP